MAAMVARDTMRRVIRLLWLVPQAATAETVAMAACWAMEDLAVMAATVPMVMRPLQVAMAAWAVPVASESMEEVAALAAMAATVTRPMVLRGLMPPIAHRLKMAVTGPMEPTAA
jgi:hypothetical protein